MAPCDYVATGPVVCLGGAISDYLLVGAPLPAGVAAPGKAPRRSRGECDCRWLSASIRAGSLRMDNPWLLGSLSAHRQPPVAHGLFGLLGRIRAVLGHVARRPYDPFPIAFACSGIEGLTPRSAA